MLSRLAIYLRPRDRKKSTVKFSGINTRLVLVMQQTKHIDVALMPQSIRIEISLGIPALLATGWDSPNQPVTPVLFFWSPAERGSVTGPPVFSVIKGIYLETIRSPNAAKRNPETPPIEHSNHEQPRVPRVPECPATRIA